MTGKLKANGCERILHQLSVIEASQKIIDPNKASRRVYARRLCCVGRAKLLSKDEAQRIAVDIAKLPDLFRKS